MSPAIELVSRHGCHGGEQRFYRHASAEIGLPMRFSVFLPPQALAGNPCPAVFYLAGLTCTEETFPAKSGAQRCAAREGIILIAPDTSPRGAGIPGESESWDLGVGAGFYVDAVQPPWSRHYQMYSYVTHELRTLAIGLFKLDPHRIGIMGHSMGGHGALVIGLRNPGLFRSVSALAPICAPTQCPWGRKAFASYLGADQEPWRQYDASDIIRAGASFPGEILVDQGLDDQFLDRELLPWRLEEACEAASQALRLRRHTGYDHGYYFVSSFIEDHLRHHALHLGD